MSSLLDESRYLEFLARTHPELRIERDLIAVPSFLAPLDTREPMAPGFWRDLAEAGAVLLPRLVAPMALYLGTPFERYDQTHLLEEVEAPGSLAEAAARHASSHGASVVALTNVSPHHSRLKDWLGAGFVALPSFPDTRVVLSSGSFEAHLASLPGADRSGIRRNIRHFQDAGHRLDRLEDSRAEGHELFGAYWPFFRRAAVHWQPHSERYFSELATLDPRVRLTVARSSEGRLLGFIVNFVDGENFQAGRIGVVPDYHRRDAVYFRLLYHVLEESLRLRGSSAASLSLEPTGYRMKRHLGARRMPMVSLVLGVSATWRRLLGQLSGFGRHLLAHLANEASLERLY